MYNRFSNWVSFSNWVLKLEGPCPLEGAAKREVREHDDGLRSSTGPFDRLIVPQ